MANVRKLSFECDKVRGRRRLPSLSPSLPPRRNHSELEPKYGKFVPKLPRQASEKKCLKPEIKKPLFIKTPEILSPVTKTASNGGHFKGLHQAEKSNTKNDPREMISPELWNRPKATTYHCDKMVEKLKMINQLLNGIKCIECRDLESLKALSQSYVDDLMAGLTAGQNTENPFQNSPSPGHYTMGKSAVAPTPNPASLVTYEVIIEPEIPPWQTFAQKGSLPVQPKPPAHRLSDKSACVAEQRKKFKAMQDRLRNRTEQILADRKSTQAVRVAYLKKSLDLNIRVDFPRLLQKMNAINRSICANPLPPKWLAGLEEEIKDQIGYQNKAMSDEIKKMLSFSTFKFSSIAYVKEKLCLLALSLPIITLMRPAVQEALWFIMDRVLRQPAQEVYSWYYYKKLEPWAI